ncbi:cytochrome b [soil metagenome]
MTQVPADGRYTLPARLFHWAVVALVVAQFAVAWTMPEIGRGTLPVGLVAWHLAIGAAILAIALLRLGWRLSHKAAPPPMTLSPALQLLSRVVHFLLYALLILLPLMGWANASARGWTVTLFGVIPLPALVAKGSALGRQMGDIHGTTAIIFLVVIGLHVAGALYHALVLRDRTLQRML